MAEKTQRFAVIGLGRFGTRLASLLAEGGADVTAVDARRELVEAMRDEVSLAVCLDATDEDALKSQGIDKVDVAIVGIGTDFESAALTTVILKQLGVPRVLVRATNSMRAQILSRIGADDIVNPERESAQRWRDKLLAPSIMERTVLAEGYSLVQVPAPKRWAGQTLSELAVGKKYQVLVVAIRRTEQPPHPAGPPDADQAPPEGHLDQAGNAANAGDTPPIRSGGEAGNSAAAPDGHARPGKSSSGEQPQPRTFVVPAPGPDTRIQPGDVLVVLGADDAIKRLPRD